MPVCPFIFGVKRCTCVRACLYVCVCPLSTRRDTALMPCDRLIDGDSRAAYDAAWMQVPVAHTKVLGDVQAGFRERGSRSRGRLAAAPAWVLDVARGVVRPLASLRCGERLTEVVALCGISTDASRRARCRDRQAADTRASSHHRPRGRGPDMPTCLSISFAVLAPIVALRARSQGSPLLLMLLTLLVLSSPYVPVCCRAPFDLFYLCLRAPVRA